MHIPAATPQHKWLHQLVGQWTMQSDDPQHPMGGIEEVRHLGELWIIGEGQTAMPDGTPGALRVTIGYDPEKGKFVGHWVGSMMANQFVYEGDLDAAGKILTLNTEGPTWEEGQSGLARYRDIYEIVSDTERLLRSEMQKADGSWTEFMRVTYKRVPPDEIVEPGRSKQNGKH